MEPAGAPIEIGEETEDWGLRTEERDFVAYSLTFTSTFTAKFYSATPLIKP